MEVSLAVATEADVAAIVELRAAVAHALTVLHGTGHWSSYGTEKEALRGIRTSRVILARTGAEIVGTLSLGTRKPWAIAPERFTPVGKPLYLRDMAVAPAAQGRGVGCRLLVEPSASPGPGRPTRYGSTPTTVRWAPGDSTPSMDSRKWDGWSIVEHG